MSLPTPAIPLPEVPIGEWTAIDTRTATGLFAHRHMQAIALMELPDYGGGDLDTSQRKEALRMAVSLQKPLAALALFLGIVALEDFIRDLAARLADNPSCSAHFPNLVKLRSQPRNRPPAMTFKRLDTDPAGVLDPEEINKVFKSAIGVETVPSTEFWHLRDLALLRHTVAHHGAVIRRIDVPRFAHFIVSPGRVINPPSEFVQEELTYLYKMGREIEKKVRSAVFKKLITATGAGWSNQLTQEFTTLIELFAYFGYFESSNVAVGYSGSETDLRREQEAEAVRVRAVLLQRCVADLTGEFGG
jgi:hypothetical protein